jgi:predicted transcriptional regulator
MAAAKPFQRALARELRAAGWTLHQIAGQLGVARSSVSVWVRDVPVEPWARRRPARRRPGSNALQQRRLAEVEELLAEGRERIGRLSEREFLVAGAALYAGEGSKSDGDVRFANTDPRMVRLFCAWLRTFFVIDESRLRARLYLHEGLDLDAATSFWSEATGIPPAQFRAPYRAVPDPTIRQTKHVNGCVSVIYACSRTHRAVMGLVHALLRSEAIPG